MANEPITELLEEWSDSKDMKSLYEEQRVKILEAAEIIAEYMSVLIDLQHKLEIASIYILDNHAIDCVSRNGYRCNCGAYDKYAEIQIKKEK